MSVSKSIISRLKKVTDGENALRNDAKGQGRNAIPLEDRYVAFIAERKRNFTPSRIAASLATTTGTHVSARPISRRVNQFGLYARNTVHCIHPTSTPPSSKQITLIKRTCYLGSPKLGLE
ncbi:hypothetical protein TNCV_4250441 [Trichonephila clavipes]|nr:hypothetical protein TNCV_4250441 [Trichonephila clavipes]